jgi:hypothetical protein
MSRNNSVPHPVYFADQFLGVKSPTPNPIKMVQPSGITLSAINQTRIPCLLDNTGGYLTLDNSGMTANSMVIKRYNAANALISSMDIGSSWYSSVRVGAAICYVQSVNLYFVAVCGLNGYSQTVLSLGYINSGGIYQLGQTNMGYPSGFGNWNYIIPTDIFARFNGSNISVVYAGNEFIFDPAFPSSTIYTPLTNGGLAVPSGLNYRTVDNSIYCSAIYGSSMDIMRNGNRVKIPVSWLNASSTAGEINTVAPFSIGDKIVFAEYTRQYPVGITSMLATEFDRWLHDICDAMGL